jgi:sugar/nucleoside kinase (ribokinase family)
LDLVSVLKSVDVLLPNEGEACRLARCDDAETTLRVLAEYVPMVVMKRGEKGAVPHCGREEVNAVPVLVDPVDTIGAGDSFDAGFLNNFIRGASLEACLRLGNLAVALSPTRQGGTEAFREAAHRSAFLNQ